jgi:hypothetical protein
VLKGEIWWAVLPKVRGSEPAKTRPVLIVQSDAEYVCALPKSFLERIDLSLKTVFDIQL